MVKNKYKIEKIVSELVQRLKLKGIDVSELILYGSYAQGTPNEYSDIDIAVVSKDFRGKGILRRQELLGEVIFPLGESIGALGYTPEERKGAHPLSFISEIIKTGKIIYRGH
jgi:uncharacterized protein